VASLRRGPQPLLPLGSDMYDSFYIISFLLLLLLLLLLLCVLLLCPFR